LPSVPFVGQFSSQLFFFQVHRGFFCFVLFFAACLLANTYPKRKGEEGSQALVVFSKERQRRREQ
jgi:hypothetical protein